MSPARYRLRHPAKAPQPACPEFAPRSPWLGRVLHCAHRVTQWCTARLGGPPHRTRHALLPRSRRPLSLLLPRLPTSQRGRARRLPEGWTSGGRHRGGCGPPECSVLRCRFGRRAGVSAPRRVPVPSCEAGACAWCCRPRASACAGRRALAPSSHGARTPWKRDSRRRQLSHQVSERIGSAEPVVVELDPAAVLPATSGLVG